MKYLKKVKYNKGQLSTDFILFKHVLHNKTDEKMTINKKLLICKLNGNNIRPCAKQGLILFSLI